MKNYELLMILSGNLKEGEDAGVLAEAKKLLEKYGGSITDEANWGRIKMAYEIQHQTHGIYVLWRLDMDPTKANAFASDLQVAENVVRVLLTEKPRNEFPITVPQMTDEREDAKKPASDSSVDNSKKAPEGAKTPAKEEKKSLDDILEEKI